MICQYVSSLNTERIFFPNAIRYYDYARPRYYFTGHFIYLFFNSFVTEAVII